MHEAWYQINTSYDIDSFSIALVADLHGKPYQKIIDSLNTNRPSYVAIVGDVIDKDSDLYPLDFFRCCAEISTTFFSLGNHERKITEMQMHEIKRTGTTVLDNSWIRSDSVVFGGMTSAFVTEWKETHKTVLRYALPKIEWLDEFEHQDGLKILLDHHPENYERITKNRDIDLILSGHAHGGQIRIFNRGLYAPHQGLFPKYTSGVYENRLVVSRGLANIKPIPRICNPTELVYIQIHNTQRFHKHRNNSNSSAESAD